MDFYLTQIILWTLNWVPDGWLICNGQQLQVRDYQALYSLIGNQFGGTANVNFNLPDLRGRIPIQYGLGTGLVNNYAFAQKYGTENTTLLTSNIPPHAHTGSVALQGSGVFQVSNDQASFATPSAGMVLAGATTNAVDAGGAGAEINIYANYNPSEMVTLSNALNLQVTGGGNFTTSIVGGGAAFGNIPPVMGLTYAMCVSGGIYPVKP